MWIVLLYCFSDFSKASDKLKRELAIIVAFSIMFSYMCLFEMHARAYDKLLRALTASEWEGGMLKNEEWLMFLRALLSTKRGSSATISTRLDNIISLSLHNYFCFFFSLLFVFLRLHFPQCGHCVIWCGRGEVILQIFEKEKKEKISKKIKKIF